MDSDSLFIGAIATSHNIVLAQQDIVGSVADGIKSYVSDIYDSKRPLASIMAFMGPGLLWKLEFPWMSVLYTVAEALGFDWKAFWSSVGKGITSFVRVIIDSGAKISDAAATSQIGDVVSSSFNGSFTGELNQEKLLNVARQNKVSSIRDVIELKALANRIQKTPGLIKKAGILSLFKGKLARFFIRIITWVVKTALISLGFVSAAGATSALVGSKPLENTDDDSEGTVSPSPKTPPDMFDVHPNDMSRVWIERGDINSIDGLLKGWILSAYPQLQDQIGELGDSSVYRSMLSKFKERNSLAAGLGMISIPRPYQRKIDVIGPIVSKFMREHQQNTTNMPAYK